MITVLLWLGLVPAGIVGYRSILAVNRLTWRERWGVMLAQLAATLGAFLMAAAPLYDSTDAATRGWCLFGLAHSLLMVFGRRACERAVPQPTEQTDTLRAAVAAGEAGMPLQALARDLERQ